MSRCGWGKGVGKKGSHQVHSLPNGQGQPEGLALRARGAGCAGEGCEAREQTHSFFFFFFFYLTSLETFIFATGTHRLRTTLSNSSKSGSLVASLVGKTTPNG